MAEALSDLMIRFLDVQETSAPENCMMLPADWVLAATGRDPAAELRGLYPWDDDRWRELGSLLEVLNKIASAAGMERAEGPARLGDVAVVRVPTAGQMGGVCVGDGRWAIKCKDGLLTHRFEVLNTPWRLSCPRP